MKRLFWMPAFAVASMIIWTGCSRSGNEQTAGQSEDTAAPAAAPNPPESAAPTPGRLAPPPSGSRTSTPRADAAPSALASTPASPATRLTVTVPEGTPLQVRTTTLLSTKTAEAGQSFVANLAEPLVVDGKVVAPRGATVKGTVVESDPGGRVRGRAFLSVRLTSIDLANGHTAEITTSTVGQEAKSSAKKDAAKVGIASGVGAAVGAIAGGGRGAAIGAGAGAAGGTGVVLATRGDPAEIPSESLLTFTLRSPITVEMQR